MEPEPPAPRPHPRSTKTEKPTTTTPTTTINEVVPPKFVPPMTSAEARMKNDYVNRTRWTSAKTVNFNWVMAVVSTISLKNHILTLGNGCFFKTPLKNHILTQSNGSFI